VLTLSLHERPNIRAFAPPKTRFGIDASFEPSRTGQDAPLAAHADRFSEPSPDHHSRHIPQHAANFATHSHQTPDMVLHEPSQEYHRPSAPLPASHWWSATGFPPSYGLPYQDHFSRDLSAPQNWRRLSRDCGASVPPANSMFQTVEPRSRSNSAPPCSPAIPPQRSPRLSTVHATTCFSGIQHSDSSTLRLHQSSAYLNVLCMRVLLRSCRKHVLILLRSAI
jgi:hypothetical protein